MLSRHRQKMIEELIAEGDGACTYCNIKVRRNWHEYEKYDHDATIDHIIPKSKGGPNSKENYCLACRRCNHAKGDRSVAEFIADPRSDRERAVELRKSPVRLRGVKTVPIPQSTASGFRFVMPRPRGATLPKEDAPVPVYEHSAYKPPVKLTGVELARAVAKIIDQPKKSRRLKSVPVAFPDDPIAQAAFVGVYRARPHLLRE